MHAPGPLRILLVEDSPYDAELLGLELQDAGLHAEVLRVERLPHIVDALAGFRPDVVISDWRLPGFSGAEVLEMVRARAPRLPFFYLCGLYEDDARTRDALACADRVLRKDVLSEVAVALQALRRTDDDALVADDPSSDA